MQNTLVLILEAAVNALCMKPNSRLAGCNSLRDFTHTGFPAPDSLGDTDEGTP